MIQDPWALIWGMALRPHTKRADNPQPSKLIQAGVLMGISVNFCSTMLLLELCCSHNLLIGEGMHCLHHHLKLESAILDSLRI